MLEIKLAGRGNVRDLYTGCYTDDIKGQQAMNKSAELFFKKEKKGWTGLVAYDDGRAVGRAEFYPLEESFAGISGDNLYFMPCINILKDHRKKGYGAKLMEELLKATSDRKGVVTWTVQEGWMPKEFFEKMGFVVASRIGPALLLLYKHQEDAKVKMLKAKLAPNNKPDKVNLDVVWSHSCPYMISNYEKLLTKAKSLSPSVEVTEHFLRERKDLENLGEMNLYVDGQTPFFGPASEEEVEKVIKEHLAKKGLDK
ncbi:MAG: GNAT family N-acetyltransferase [Candidatus Zixiibacteriota bacterium]